MPLTEIYDGQQAQAFGVLDCVTKIVVAFLTNNAMRPDHVPELITQTYAALRSTLGVVPPAEALPSPAVPIAKSVAPNYIVCLDDGKKFKSLKRHIALLGMTPQQYRAKWGLPVDYPMVAPGYAAVRSSIAVSSRLGHRRDALSDTSQD